MASVVLPFVRSCLCFLSKSTLFSRILFCFFVVVAVIFAVISYSDASIVYRTVKVCKRALNATMLTNFNALLPHWIEMKNFAAETYKWFSSIHFSNVAYVCVALCTVSLNIYFACWTVYFNFLLRPEKSAIFYRFSGIVCGG